MMKRYLLLLLFGVFFSCENQLVEKPDNLIDEDKMVEVLYDLSVLEAIKSQRSVELAQSGVDYKTYIYEKHKIDSVQFAKSNRYYASDLDNYKKIFDKVKERIEKQKIKSGMTSAKTSKPLDDTPQVQ